MIIRWDDEIMKRDLLIFLNKLMFDGRRKYDVLNGLQFDPESDNDFI